MNKDAEFKLRFETVRGVPMQQVCEELGVEWNDMHHVRCPLPSHPGDNTPSCKFYDNNSFACFGCREGGSTVDLVAKVKQITAGAALIWIETKILKKRYKKGDGDSGLKTRLSGLSSKLKKRANPTREETFKVHEFMSQLAKFVADKMHGMKEAHPDAARYLESQRERVCEPLYSLYGESSKEECEAVRDYIQSELAYVERACKGIQDLANTEGAD